MANLRRHFNFSTKLSSLSPQGNASSNITSIHSDRHSLMNNICSCLDICSAYIQALNSLCGTGSLLARNLLQTVQNVPAYQNVAQQFLCIWDEVGKATAGASAAVKTETLMMLQEVLNTLETCANDNTDVSTTDSFQVIGSCLHSLIELQAQFSMSTWKSLSKLSKSFSNDAFIHTLYWKSQDRNPLKVAKNAELSSTIKKHYSHLLRKYEMQKSYESMEAVQNQLYAMPTVLNNQIRASGHNQCGLQTECVGGSTPKTVVWSPGTTLWSAAKESSKEAPQSSPAKHNRVSEAPALSVGCSELDEVINLLSCVPVGQFSSTVPESSHNQSAYENSLLRSYQFWPPDAGPVLPRHQRPWSDGARDSNFFYDSWIWRSDNMNCSALPNGEFKEFGSAQPKVNESSWNNVEFKRWSTGTRENGSSSDDASSNQGQDIDSFSLGTDSLAQHEFFPSIRQRRYSSSDGLPDTQDDPPEAESRIWNAPVHKTSTWPLKQSSSRSTDLEWSQGLVESKCVPLYYTPTS